MGSEPKKVENLCCRYSNRKRLAKELGATGESGGSECTCVNVSHTIYTVCDVSYVFISECSDRKRT